MLFKNHKEQKIHGQNYTIIIEKKSINKWIHKVQTHVVQGQLHYPYEEKNPSIQTKPELGKMSELADHDIKTAIITTCHMFKS